MQYLFPPAAPVSVPVSKPLEEEILPWKKNIKAAILEMLR